MFGYSNYIPTLELFEFEHTLFTSLDLTFCTWIDIFGLAALYIMKPTFATMPMSTPYSNGRNKHAKNVINMRIKSLSADIQINALIVVTIIIIGSNAGYDGKSVLISR